MAPNTATDRRAPPVLIVGTSRLGAALGRRLARAGCHVTMVGQYVTDRWRVPADCYTSMVVGGAHNPQTLERAGIDTAWAVLALTSDDNINLVVADAAKWRYRTPMVVALLVDAARLPDYLRLGIETISPEHLAEQVLWDRVVGGMSL